MQQRRTNPDLDLHFTDSIFNQALILLEDTCLGMAGKLLVQLGLPAPIQSAADPSNFEILRETSYNAEEMLSFVSSNEPSLVADQRMAYDRLITAIDDRSGGLFFLDAPGGTGKDFLDKSHTVPRSF